MVQKVNVRDTTTTTDMQHPLQQTLACEGTKVAQTVVTTLEARGSLI